MGMSLAPQAPEAPQPPAAASEPTPEPAPPPPPRGPMPAVVALVVALPAAAVAILLAVPAVWDLAGDLRANTAVALGSTAAGMVFAAALGACMRAGMGRVHGGMTGSMVAMVVLGLPLFVALEPAWWRFAMGLVGPMLVVLHVVHGAAALDPSAKTPEPQGVRAVLRVAGQWWLMPLTTSAALMRSLLGLDRHVPMRAPRRSP